MRGFKNIFAFTLKNQMRSKAYRTATIVIALVLFILPLGIMTVVQIIRSAPEAEVVQPSAVYYYADVLGGDYSFLGESDWIQVESYEEGKSKIGTDGVLIIIKEDESQFVVSGIVPDGRDDLKTAAGQICSMLKDGMTGIVATAYGLSLDTVAKVVEIVYSTGDEKTATSPAELISYFLTYGNIFLIYFMVLLYGNGVAQNVLLEKSSKLMDLFLTSVKPRAMVFGKVLAYCLSAIVQMLIILAGLVLGFLGGYIIVGALAPSSDMEIMGFIKTIGSTSGFFTVPAVIIAIIMIMCGFVMYCSIASLGGSLASKREDLGQTNQIFTLIILASYLVLIFGGFMSTGSAGKGFGVFDIIPFTSMMVTPARVLTGIVSPGQGLVSLLLIALTAVLLMLLSGKIYKAMSLYKGSVPKLGRIFTIMKAEKEMK